MQLGPSLPFLGEGSPTKIDYRRKKRLVHIQTSLLEDLVLLGGNPSHPVLGCLVAL